MQKYIHSLLVLLLVTTFSAHSDEVKTFKFSDSGTPTTFDPAQSSTSYSNTIVTAVYDTLYEYKYLKRPYELKPNLATAMPKVSKDGLTYTIKIKPGFTLLTMLHLLTAKVVKYTRAILSTRLNATLIRKAARKVLGYGR